jgi:hypothetical protein
MECPLCNMCIHEHSKIRRRIAASSRHTDRARAGTGFSSRIRARRTRCGRWRWLEGPRRLRGGARRDARRRLRVTRPSAFGRGSSPRGDGIAQRIRAAWRSLAPPRWLLKITLEPEGTRTGAAPPCPPRGSRGGAATRLIPGRCRRRSLRVPGTAFHGVPSRPMAAPRRPAGQGNGVEPRRHPRGCRHCHHEGLNV